MNKPKGTATAFRFDPTVKAALQAIADREGRSMANMIEWLIRKHCEREGLGWPPTGVVESVDSSQVQVAAVRSQLAGGDTSTRAGESPAVVGRKNGGGGVVPHESQAKPVAKKAKNTKAGK